MAMDGYVVIFHVSLVHMQKPLFIDYMHGYAWLDKKACLTVQMYRLPTHSIHCYAHKVLVILQTRKSAS